MGELARLDSGAGVHRPGAVHAGEDLEDVTGRAVEANRAVDPVLLRLLASNSTPASRRRAVERVERGAVVGLERDVVQRGASAAMYCSEWWQSPWVR